MLRMLAVLLAFATQAQAQCRQALAMGLDISASVDAGEYRLQIDGLAAALDSPPVREKLFAGPEAPVRILVYEWSGPTDQTLILPWTQLNTGADLDRALATLRAHQRTAGSETTAIGAALSAGVEYLAGQDDCWKRTLDISGDGSANTGLDPARVITPSWITVNGLVVGSGNMRGDDERFADIKQLSSYYRTRVIRGPDAFVETALGFEDYANAMQRKLIRELAAVVTGGLAPAQHPMHPARHPGLTGQ